MASLVLGIALLALVAWALRSRLGLGVEPESWRDLVEEMGFWAPAGFVAMITFRALLLLPSQLLLMGAGLVFGATAGTLYGALGMTLSGVLYFGAARWAGREFVVSRVPERMRPAFDAAGTRMGAAFLAVGTGYPFGPLTAYHTGAGLTGMSFVTFLAAVGAGSLVRAATYAFFGSRLLDGSLGAIALGAGVLALAFVAPLCVPRSRRWLLGAIAPRRAAPAPTSPGDAGRSGPTPP